MNTYNVSILSPAGNITALAEGIPSLAKRKSINQELMQMQSDIEQVGFYERSSGNTGARLEMAGGEFCGNALRSLAYLLLKGVQGEMMVTSSGTTRKLLTGVKSQNTAFAEMPIKSSAQSVIDLGKGITKVDLDGITHLLTQYNNESAQDLKVKAKKILGRYGLLESVPAAGVMFVSDTQQSIKLQPVVWVRDIKTLFYESSCASGSTACALWKASQQDIDDITVKILQPSKEILTVNVKTDAKGSKSAFLDGPIKIVQQFEFSFNYGK